MSGDELRVIYLGMQWNERMDWLYGLSGEEQKKLFGSLSHTEQNQFLASLSFADLKVFLSRYDGRERRNLYQRLEKKQLIAIYNSLNEDEKKEMAMLLEEIQVDLLEDIAQKRDEINNAASGIQKSTNAIEQNTIQIANSKIEIQNQKQQFKKNNIQLKKLDKERKKRLKRVLKASKPSVLDRVGIFSKRRTRKLMERVQALESTNQEIASFREANALVQQNIIKEKMAIEQAKANIQQAKEDMILHKKTIRSNTKRIGNIEVKMRVASKQEKQVLGRKMYRKQVQMRDCLISHRKQQSMAQQSPIRSNNTISNVNVSTNSNQRQQQVVQQSKNTQQVVNNLLGVMEEFDSMGIDFTNDAPNISMVSPDVGLENQIADLTKDQQVTLSYALPVITDYQKRVKQQQSNLQQAQNMGRSRVLKQSSGVVSLTLLLSIILFVFSIFLFFLT